MFSKLAQTILFLSSYAPLLFVFALLDSFGAGLPSILCATAGAGSILGLWLILRSVPDLGTSLVAVSTARPRDEDVMAYVVTYLLPFLGLATDTGREQLALLVFVLVVAVLYVRSRLFYVNPILSVIGYRLFEVTSDEGRPVILLTKHDYLRQGTELPAHQVSNYVFVEQQDDQR